jgi:UDP-2,3-diacylglucosamine hydrolase
VAHYFASDIHLRFDRPDRDRRFRTWLSRLSHDDSVIIVGDLCDFWMGSRRRDFDLNRCESLRGLAEFRREGGSLAIMAGNHDAWLCPFYQNELGAQILTEPYDMTLPFGGCPDHDLRLRLVHGHLLGARRPWKALMESRAFFEGFGHVPRPIARAMDHVLAWRNERGLEADERRHLRVYREYAAALRGSVDLVVIGHVHGPVDDAGTVPRLIVLGGWQHRTSYLRIDSTGAQFHVKRDDPPVTPDTPSTTLSRDHSAVTHEAKLNEN